jgi:hypothetical protein
MATTAAGSTGAAPIARPTATRNPPTTIGAIIRLRPASSPMRDATPATDAPAPAYTAWGPSTGTPVASVNPATAA